MAVRTHVSTIEELKAQLENPTPETVRARAREVFGDHAKADSWLGHRRAIFDGKSPNEMIDSGDPDQMRRVLVILGRIEAGAIS
jgi:uncharacterized protein (DUF2384 family)